MELEEILDDLLPPALCYSCVHHSRYPIQSPCFKCIEFVDGKEIPTGEFYKKIKITNHDNLRAMSSDEFAYELAHITECPRCPARREHCGADCHQAWLDWLNGEVEHG